MAVFTLKNIMLINIFLVIVIVIVIVITPSGNDAFKQKTTKTQPKKIVFASNTISITSMALVHSGHRPAYCSSLISHFETFVSVCDSVTHPDLEGFWGSSQFLIWYHIFLKLSMSMFNLSMPIVNLFKPIVPKKEKMKKKNKSGVDLFTELLGLVCAVFNVF